MKTQNRIPFETIGDYTYWSAPTIDGQVVRQTKQPKKNATEKTRDNNDSNEEPDNNEECVEEISGDVTIKPLTAQQLEEIAKATEKEAYEKGYQEGITQGLATGESEGRVNGEAKAYQEKSDQLAQQVSQLQVLCEALMEPMTLQSSCVENLVLDMAAGFAKRLLSAELDSKPEKMFPIVKQVVESLPVSAAHIKVYMHSADVVRVQESLGPEHGEWQFIEDDSLDVGSVRLQTDDSLINYSVASRIQQFFDGIKLSESESMPVQSEVEDFATAWQEQQPESSEHAAQNECGLDNNIDSLADHNVVEEKATSNGIEDKASGVDNIAEDSDRQDETAGNFDNSGNISGLDVGKPQGTTREETTRDQPSV